MKRWFPKVGDLVAVPYEGEVVPGVIGRCSYGLVLYESDSDFKGVWWTIFYNGKRESLHIHVIKPIMDLHGTWLQVK